MTPIPRSLPDPAANTSPKFRARPLSSEESGEAPAEEERTPLTKEEVATWEWLVMRDVPGGLSAHEMADDFGISSDVAALRLASITVLGLAHEVSPGRYRPGEGETN